MLPKKLQDKLDARELENSLRKLRTATVELVDFSSNDYLGFSKSNAIFSRASEILKEQQLEINGATGSRLLSGNHSLYTETEKAIAQFHQTAAALIFNSGYDANVGFFSSVPQRGDVILYDALCHASIRDGIKMSHAKSYKFEHNDLDDLRRRIWSLRTNVKNHTSSSSYDIYIVTESIFSMDGDAPDLKELVKLSKEFEAYLIVDEAHALGVIGTKGEGLVQRLGLEKEVFARLVTFGKGLGCHGAAIVGSEELKGYLVNFARSFIYSTGLPPHSVATIQAAYEELRQNTDQNISLLYRNIAIFKIVIKEHELDACFISSDSAIQSCVLKGNDEVKQLSAFLEDEGFDVKPILSPTVAAGEERLRICLHSYNTETEIKKLVSLIANRIPGDRTQ